MKLLYSLFIGSLTGFLSYFHPWLGIGILASCFADLVWEIKIEKKGILKSDRRKDILMKIMSNVDQ